MKLQGLSASQVEESRQKFGANTLTQIPPDPLWKKIMEGFKDPMIMILLVALVVQVVLFFLGQAEWFEPVGILIAIMIANGVASISESKQEGKASALKAEEEAKEMAKVLRDGKLEEIHVSEVVVGDIVYLQAGDKIPADGEVVEGELKVDQAALNGETEEADKLPCPAGVEYDVKDLLNKHYAYRGTVVCGGEAYMEIKVVGDKTLFGELALEVQEETRETPLQVKLGKLAQQISTFGYVGAICIVVGIIAKTLLSGSLPGDIYEWIRLVMDAVTVAVKTGTRTEGRLSVVELADGDLQVYENLAGMTPTVANDVITGIGVNNSAVLSDGAIIGGNSTDRALISFLADAGAADKINKDEVKAFNAFDSNKKSSSVVLQQAGQTVTYVKGAPEKIIERCSHYLNAQGERKELTERRAINAYMDKQAGRSMRLLAVAKADGEKDDENLTLVCVLSIRDNVRKEAIEAIHQVQNAGVQVVMVTGDRKETAVAIAKEAGLLQASTDVALTSAEMAAKTDDELKAILPNLRVVSRALPTDKSRLVRVAQELNLVVGMTGDGVNDSPALKKADVGFAMGSGTEVAKEAGDITILDDNFSSIRKAILYGRTMFKSIRKFLIFQLTVNVAAVLTCFIGPLLGENVVMTVIQLLLVNLAMDTLAAIAFGSEPALEEYMRDKPIERSASIISKDMLVEIVIGALYITFICLAILFVPAIRGLFGDVDITYLKSAVFATFMMAITFNGFNARTTHLNVLSGIGRNKNFIWVMLSIFVLQFVFVTFGGNVLSVESLSPQAWLTCLAMAFLVIPIDMLRKLFMGQNR